MFSQIPLTLFRFWLRVSIPVTSKSLFSLLHVEQQKCISSHFQHMKKLEGLETEWLLLIHYSQVNSIPICHCICKLMEEQEKKGADESYQTFPWWALHCLTAAVGHSEPCKPSSDHKRVTHSCCEVLAPPCLWGNTGQDHISFLWLNRFLVFLCSFFSLQLQQQPSAATQQPPGLVQISDFLQNFPQQCFPLSVCVCIPIMMHWAGENGWGNISSLPWLPKELWDCWFQCCFNVSLLFESLNAWCSTLGN